MMMYIVFHKKTYIALNLASVWLLV